MSKPDFIYSIFFHGTIIIGVYLNLWGVQLWFKAGNYFKYAAFVVVAVVVTVVFNQYTFKVIVDLILPDYYFVSQFNNAELGVIVILYFVISFAVKLSKSWFDLQRINKRMVEIENEKVDSELRSLKAQINPHFLFNGLNVIYSLALKKDNSTPDVILKLSDILRYVIYDSTQDYVSLKSEVVLLEKYIDLQKFRVERLTPISFKYSIEKDIKLAPLLLLTLVENSFKHGIKGDTDNVFVNIKLVSDIEKIHFEIENNKAETEPSISGIGLENIRKRLMLLYPDRHSFNIFDTTDSFKVNLEIKHEG